MNRLRPPEMERRSRGRPVPWLIALLCPSASFGCAASTSGARPHESACELGEPRETSASRIIGGAPAPSANDVQFYRSAQVEHGLGGAWITNGFDTARYTAADLARMQAASPSR